MNATTDVLDPCCGSRMFYFDKSDDRVTFCDRYPRHSVLCDLPFPDESFRLVIFDPPQLTRGHGWQVEKYGVLDADWHRQLTRGFSECFRVLQPGGVLVFKWCEYAIPLGEVLSCTPESPICGNRRPRASKTHWVLFMKG